MHRTLASTSALSYSNIQYHITKLHHCNTSTVWKTNLHLKKNTLTKCDTLYKHQENYKTRKKKNIGLWTGKWTGAD